MPFSLLKPVINSEKAVRTPHQRPHTRDQIHDLGFHARVIRCAAESWILRYIAPADCEFIVSIGLSVPLRWCVVGFIPSSCLCGQGEAVFR